MPHPKINFTEFQSTKKIVSPMQAENIIPGILLAGDNEVLRVALYDNLWYITQGPDRKWRVELEGEDFYSKNLLDLEVRLFVYLAENETFPE